MRGAASSPCQCPQSLRETKPSLREWALEARSLLVGRLRPGWEREGHAPPSCPQGEAKHGETFFSFLTLPTDPGGLFCQPPTWTSRGEVWLCQPHQPRQLVEWTGQSQQARPRPEHL